VRSARWLLGGTFALLLLLILLQFAFAFSSSIDSYNAQIKNCRLGALSRWQDYVVLRAQIVGDTAVASDPSQPARTRVARTLQARKERQAARIKRALTAPTDGGRVAYCRAHYPKPGPLG
jgi:cob(I)alamin adenosyltransferase